MQMKRETIANKGIWKAKKMYILNAWNVEGVQYSEPKLKIQGIEAVRSSTPAPIRAYIKEALNIIMGGTEDELIEFIATKREEWEHLPINEIGFPRTANNVGKYADATTLYKKSTPMHIRGALMFNHYIKLNISGILHTGNRRNRISFDTSRCNCSIDLR